MAYLRDLDVYLEIVRNAKYAGKDAYDYSFWGVNPDIDTGSVPEDVWKQGGVFVPPTTYRVHNLASSAAADTSAGTGARTVLVTGVTSNGIESETVTMNGASNVATVKSYSDLWMEVATVGSGGVNAGNITATAQTDSTITATILASNGNITKKAIRLVPPGYKAYVFNFSAGMYQATASSYADVYLKVSESGVWHDVAYHSLSNSGSSFEESWFKLPIEYSAGTWIKAQCTYVSNSNTLIQARSNILLIEV